MCGDVHVFGGLVAWWLLQPMPCVTECWTHYFVWNKNTKPHTQRRRLFSALHWQAVIPALAYEREQLEGVAVTVVPCCIIHLDGTASVLTLPCRGNVHCCTPTSLSVPLSLSVRRVFYFTFLSLTPGVITFLGIVHSFIHSFISLPLHPAAVCGGVGGWRLEQVISCTGLQFIQGVNKVLSIHPSGWVKVNTRTEMIN